jgi:TolB-like protein
MNARIERPDQLGGEAPASDEIRRALRHVIASAAFAKAPRMCNLLSFLVEKKLGGEEGGLTEYAIGMQLFRRDPASYNTTTDPVVRVQVGRLRTRLADYYVADDAGAGLQITIPAGSYVPALQQVARGAAKPAGQRLELAPLRCLTLDPASGAFAGGVDEELCARMFAMYPGLVQVRDRRAFDFGRDSPAGGAQLRLEGSIRVEESHVRASMRLVDNSAGHTAWTAQFDCSGALGIALQEQLANAICGKLADHFATGQPGWFDARSEHARIN